MRSAALPPEPGADGAPAGFLSPLWIGAVLLLLLVGGMVGLSLRESRARRQRETLRQAQSQAEILEQSLGNSIQILDVSLDAVVEEYLRLREQRRFDAAAFQDYLLRMHRRLPPFLEGLRAIDAEGRLRYGNALPATPIQLQDRDYFIRLKADPKAGLVFSKPVVARVSKKWAIILARRLEAPDGRFEGVVYATVLLEQLTKAFASLDLGPRGVVALRDPGNTLIVRYPPSPRFESQGAELAPPRPFRELVDAGHTEGTYTVAGALDGQERTFAMRRVRDYPLFVLVGRSTQDARDAWRREALGLGLLFFPLALVTLGCAALLHRGWTRQEAALRALARQEHRFRLLFEGAGDAIFIQDMEGRLLEVNPTAYERLGLRPPEGPSAPDPELARRLQAPSIRDMMGDQDRLLLETTQAGPEGELQHVEISSRRLDYEGHPAILSISRDLGERRRIDRLKEEFVSLVSHELRTPLTSIRGALGLMKEGAAGSLLSAHATLLDTALRNTDRLVGLVNDLLDLQRMERGMLPVSLRAMELGPLLQEALAAQAPFGTLFQVGYDLELPATPLRIQGDAQRLHQILANLLSNATRFSPPGGRVRVRAAAHAGAARIEVRDEGPGIPEVFRSRVFHKFSQSHTGNTRQAGGTGLGLSITKALVELHGGRIGFECPPEGGTLFWFEVPLLAPGSG